MRVEDTKKDRPAQGPQDEKNTAAKAVAQTPRLTPEKLYAAVEGLRSSNPAGKVTEGPMTLISHDDAVYALIQSLNRSRETLWNEMTGIARLEDVLIKLVGEQFNSRQLLLEQLRKLRRVQNDLMRIDTDLKKLARGRMNFTMLLNRAAVFMVGLRIDATAHILSNMESLLQHEHKDTIHYFYEEDFHHLIPSPAEMLFEIASAPAEDRDDLFGGGGWKFVMSHFKSWDSAMEDLVPEGCAWDGYDLALPQN